MASFDWKALVGGFLLGTVGVDLMKKEEADKVYTEIAAAALVARDWIMERYVPSAPAARTSWPTPASRRTPTWREREERPLRTR